KRVFPDYRTTWHFDDKVGQKYLFESIDAPVVPSHVFYDRCRALEWAASTTYPKVFKLRGGAGATNVRLVSNFKECRRIIKKAFSKGFPAFTRWTMFKDYYRQFVRDRNLKRFIKSVARFIFTTEDFKMSVRQKGYVYFQDFVPNNNCDIRLIVID